jgi:glycogen synthase
MLGMASRFVSQKGIDILAMTIQKLNKNWDKKFKGMPRPLFVVGGQDYESGKIKDMMIEAKKSLGENGKYILYVDGFAPGNIYQAGCTHYLFPSWFEPCGSQAEAMGKGCVPIATKVGGLADMIKHNETGYLTPLSEKEVIDLARQRLYEKGIDSYSDYGAFEYEKTNIMSDYYLEQVESALSDFYYNPKKYQSMVLNSMKQDFSWIVFDENGKISGSLCKYLEEFGISLDK